MTASGPRNNSRMGQPRPDVAHDGPFRTALGPLLADFSAGKIDGVGFQQGVLAALTEPDVQQIIATAADTARATAADATIWRHDFGDRDITISVIHLRAGEVHPPHHHHNVTSVQVILEGRVSGREYDRIRRLDETHVLLKPLSDGQLRVGSRLLAQEWSRNAHWFAASADAPALIFNCNARGFEARTFDMSDGRPLGRRLLLPSRTATDEGIVAREIDVAEAYETFGAIALKDWPSPATVLSPAVAEVKSD
ncbi:MAG: hypothetical protein P1U65_07895 [Minwuia sp.]|nr:hypothetical protein [Minwuia sp.]